MSSENPNHMKEHYLDATEAESCTSFAVCAAGKITRYPSQKILRATDLMFLATITWTHHSP